MSLPAPTAPLPSNRLNKLTQKWIRTFGLVVGIVFALMVLHRWFGPMLFQNEFGAHANRPHALLRGTKYPHAGKVFITHVNDQAMSFWRFSDIVQIAPGITTCRSAFSDRMEVIGYKKAQFVATAGRDYVIARKRELDLTSPFTATPHPTTINAWIIHDARDRVTIRESEPNGSNLLVADAPREDYVFDVPSSASAIAEYYRRNP